MRALTTLWVLALLAHPGVSQAQGLPQAGNAGESVDKRKFRKSRLTNDESEMTSDRRKLLLATGEDKTVDLDFDTSDAANRIVIGNPKTVLTTLVRVGDKLQLVFKPLSTGETTVTVRDSDGLLRLIFDVRVAGTNLMKTAAELRELLRDIEGIDVRILGRKIIIDGEVLVPSDYGRVLNVITDQSYAGLVLNLAIISPVSMQALTRKIQKDINLFAPNVTARLVNGQVWLEGTVDNLDQARRSQRVGELYLPDLRPGSPLEKDPNVQRLPKALIQNFIVINPPPPKKQEQLVRVNLHFVELSKDYSKIFGFKWQPGLTADASLNIGASAATGTTSAAASNAFTATISSLFPRLFSAQDAGFARILKSGAVVVRSGQPASINELTKIPFALVGANGQVTSSSENVGLTVSVTPLILGQSEDIQMDLELIAKNLVARGQDGSPIVAEHKVVTKTYVKSAESAAIAGLNTHDINTIFNKDDPARGGFSNNTQELFNLRRTKNFTKNKKQVVIFVTPQIINSASEGTEDLKRNFRVKVQ